MGRQRLPAPVLWVQSRKVSDVEKTERNSDVIIYSPDSLDLRDAKGTLERAGFKVMLVVIDEAKPMGKRLSLKSKRLLDSMVTNIVESRLGGG